MKRDDAVSRLKEHEADFKRLGVASILGRSADIMTRDSLHKTLRRQIEATAIRVF
jgi:hypothetical protein